MDRSSFIIPWRSLERPGVIWPGVVVPDRACGGGISCVLDFDLGRERLIGLRAETREEDRESIEGVVGAERPSI